MVWFFGDDCVLEVVYCVVVGVIDECDEGLVGG